MAIGVGAYVYRAQARAPKDDRASASPRVTVLMPARREFATLVAITGLISARNDLPIGSEGDAARITQILVEAGQTVRAGQVLARLDAGIATSRVYAAQAALEEARAAAALARAEWLRAQQGPDLFS
ncbi:MAG TPA: biotin/lipoyl-binding protein, partial [Steroidobacteraceae bacterium]|nr:biotin/lipoyl-binding protein [Steroidobacteraceae bacterium]